MEKQEKTKKCIDCGKTSPPVPVDAFVPCAWGIKNLCRECNKKRNIDYICRKKKGIKPKIDTCRFCKKMFLPKDFRSKYCSDKCKKNNKKKRDDIWRKSEYGRKMDKKYGETYRLERKKEVVSIYGGKCECCGEKRMEFLTIDHIDGKGAEHRKKIKRSNVYNWLRKNGYPKENFRLLCMNCNFSMGKYGYCPHNKE